MFQKHSLILNFISDDRILWSKVSNEFEHTATRKKIEIQFVKKILSADGKHSFNEVYGSSYNVLTSSSNFIIYSYQWTSVYVVMSLLVWSVAMAMRCLFRPLLASVAWSCFVLLALVSGSLFGSVVSIPAGDTLINWEILLLHIYKPTKGAFWHNDLHTSLKSQWRDGTMNPPYDKSIMRIIEVRLIRWTSK